MAFKKMTIKSTKKANFGQDVEIDAYYWNKSDKPLGIAIGHFAPFTGKNGHARLLYEAEKNGIEEFVIYMPANKSAIDDDRNMFTAEQKEYIVQEGCNELGIDVLEAKTAKLAFPAAILGDASKSYPNRRIVLLCGPDRTEEYLKYCVPYDPNNTPDLDPESPNFRKFELCACEDRGDDAVSGTYIRKLIRDGRKNEFIKLTGYTEKMWNAVRKFVQENGVVDLGENESFSSFLGSLKLMAEEVKATKREGIKHLYNPGNSQQLSAQDFIDIARWLKKQNGKLDDAVNVSYSEKCDGNALRFGLDSEGKFFVEQSYSGPVYDRSHFENKNKEKYGYVTRLGKEWGNLLDKLRADKNIQNVLKKYTTDSGIKIIAEVYINALGAKGQKDDTLRFVGTEYYKSKIGSFCSIILINGLDGEGNELKNFDKVRDALEAISTDKIMFDDCNYSDKFGSVDLNDEIDELEALIKDIELEYGEDVIEILNSKDRTKSAVEKRKAVKAAIEEYQGKFNDKIKALFDKTDGKWGPDREGIVLKLANDRLLKITSDAFKNFKANHDNSHGEWLMGPADEE